MEKQGRNQFFLLDTVHNTQPFGKLKQTLSKKQQVLAFESVIEEADP